jgi:hypothetical protein
MNPFMVYLLYIGAMGHHFEESGVYTDQFEIFAWPGSNKFEVWEEFK